ncbi:MAG: hypothetical protein IJ877_01380, partial [Candidatus Gastranaerophilales bacterium]|nr:hypothetical protein [Candidatus Gastranaerophilales bacterium]
ELQQQDEDGSMAESISALQGEIQTAQAAEEEAKAALEEAKAQLETLKGEKETLDGELTEAQTALSDVQAEVPEGNEKIESAQADWDEAKQGFSELKDQMLATAQTDVDNAINRVNEVQTALSEAQRQQTLAQYTNYNAQAGERLANQAHTVAGTVGYCMGGVCDTLQRTYGCSMYGLGSAYMAADALRGNTPGYEEIASHFTEVEVPRDELASLPAGYIVVWDNNQNGGGSNVSSAGRVHGHISISLGDGRESSDHIQNQITNRDANYTVFAPIS